MIVIGSNRRLERHFRRAGMTLVEVMVAIVIMTVAVYILSSTVTAAIGHTTVKRERNLAVNAALNLLEIMRAEPFEDLLSLYNEDPGDDPGLPGSAPGRNFGVFGLDAQQDDPDGLVGEIILPMLNDELREDMELATLSMPRDLNGDLMVDSADHSDDYIVLPVMIRIAWNGKAGNRDFEMSTMFAKLEKLDE